MMGIPFPTNMVELVETIYLILLLLKNYQKHVELQELYFQPILLLCAGPIYTFGTEEQKKKYLIPLAKGEKLGAFGLTEPNAGTDAAGQQTTASFRWRQLYIKWNQKYLLLMEELQMYL